MPTLSQRHRDKLWMDAIFRNMCPCFDDAQWEQEEENGSITCHTCQHIVHYGLLIK